MKEREMQRMDRIISEQIRNFIHQNFLFGRGFDLGDSDSFLENSVIDSTGVLELVAFLEETYGITVENEELIPENLDSLENVTAYVSRKVGGAVSVNAMMDLRGQA